MGINFKIHTAIQEGTMEFSLWPSGCEFKSRPSQYLLLFFFLKMRQKVSLGLSNFGVRTARVKIELTDFRKKG